ncbi:SusC/RagA family TonB-linked outer membrane protein [Parafilimonas sp.]|uniref:SusC/RagA family TonB-linked outer membrane protein n=1 Tax=Parafilimonas sp. TaxID=1969739 RepID=UPI0039E411AF
MRKLFFLISITFYCLQAFAQAIHVKGKVVGEDGLPVPGVTITNKKTSKIVGITDTQGAFSLNLSSAVPLVFSSIEFESKELPAADTMTVVLKASVQSLTDVVVTGTGVATSKQKLGIAVQSITSDKLPPTPSASIDQALIGKVPGAQISSISGNPGDPVNIVLRGINTVQNGTKPMILLDGVELKTDLNSIDMSTIERVEVVQGAASATLYGAQGANGVIQLFTKKGLKGRLSVNASTSYSTNEFLNTGKVHKAQLHPYLTDDDGNVISQSGDIVELDEYGDYPYSSTEGISYRYGGNGASAGYGAASRYAILDPRNISDQAYGQNLKYYDHFSQVFKTGYTTNSSISISGGSEKGDFSVSASNNHTLSSIMKNGALDRSNLSLNLGTTLLKGLTFRSITQLVYTRNTMKPGLGSAGGYSYGKGQSLGNVGGVYSFLNTSPFFDLTWKDADGNSPAYQIANFLSVNAFNPYYKMEYSDAVDNKEDIVQNFDLNYKISHFVELDAKYGINYRTENSRWTYYNQSENLNSNYWETWTGYFNGDDNTGEIDNWQYNNTFQNFQGNIYVKTDFEKDFGLNIPIQTNTQLGFDYRKSKYKEYDTYGLFLPLVPPINISSTSSQAVAWDYVEPFVTYGFLVNQVINIGNYAGITGGFRSDYSSAFGGGSKPFTFPRVNGFFAPSALDFWQNGKISGVLPYFKLRAAYGEAGIQPGPFDRYPVLSQSNLNSGLAYAIPTTPNNADLQVEVSKELEIGTDLTVNLNKSGDWFSKANIGATYWKRKSENVIYSVSIPLSTGATSKLTNAIDMSSNGIELSLSLPIIHGRNWSWDLTTNFGHMISKIDAIAGGVDIPITSGAGDATEVLVAGQKIGQIYGYKTLRSVTDTRTDKTRYIDDDDAGAYEVVTSPYRNQKTLVDTATKQIMFGDETVPLGDPNPKFNMSFINSISYKGAITFSFQFDWVNGTHLYNQTKEWMYRDGISGDFAVPVTISGQTHAYTAYWASAYYGLWGSSYGAGNNATKDFYMEGASFLRLRNVSLAFDLAKLIKQNLVKFNKFELVFSGRNIWTSTKYTGYDPEISSGSVNSSFDRGLDHSTLPNIKSYQVGLNIGL